MNLIIFLTSYFIIILSIFGYSLALHDIFKKISLEFEFNFLGSIFFLIFYLFLHIYFSNIIFCTILLFYLLVYRYFCFSLINIKISERLF